MIVVAPDGVLHLHHRAHAVRPAHLRRRRQRTRPRGAPGSAINKVKISVFALASTLAAFGGILAASRLFAVNQQSGSGDVLLLAIAGPVIAGTSLFGGRGFVWSALLGAIVIGSISNGMDLLGLDSDIKFMVTGAVLLAAVTIDAADAVATAVEHALGRGARRTPPQHERP